jgi:hypothetical protein
MHLSKRSEHEFLTPFCERGARRAICQLKGRLHSRFLRPFLCPRWRRRPTASFARSHTWYRARKAKEAVGQWRHCGRRNSRKKRECRRPFNRENTQNTKFPFFFFQDPPSTAPRCRPVSPTTLTTAIPGPRSNSFLEPATRSSRFLVQRVWEGVS